jgi:hypothetical protein
MATKREPRRLLIGPYVAEPPPSGRPSNDHKCRHIGATRCWNVDAAAALSLHTREVAGSKPASPIGRKARYVGDLQRGLEMREVGMRRDREHGEDPSPPALVHVVVTTAACLNHRVWRTTRQRAGPDRPHRPTGEPAAVSPRRKPQQTCMPVPMRNARAAANMRSYRWIDTARRAIASQAARVRLGGTT